MSADESAGTAPKGASVILYDGVCGLCNRFVRFVLRHDRAAEFFFAPLASQYAAEILSRHGLGDGPLDTVVLATAAGTAQETLLFRSDAATEVLLRLGGVWAIWARLLRWLPRSFRDARYRMVARYRYRVFGRYDTCPVPDARVRSRFLG